MMYAPKHKVKLRQRLIWAIQDTVGIMSLVLVTVGLAILIGELITC